MFQKPEAVNYLHTGPVDVSSFVFALCNERLFSQHCTVNFRISSLLADSSQKAVVRSANLMSELVG